MKLPILLAASLVAALCGLAPALAQPAAYDDLADLHEQVGKLECRDCHGASKPKSVPPEAALRTANERCVACHGTAANVAAKIEPRLPNRHVNPHAGHVVSIECVTCHGAHRESASYCVQCHAFDMPMKLGRPSAAR